MVENFGADVGFVIENTDPFPSRENKPIFALGSIGYLVEIIRFRLHFALQVVIGHLIDCRWQSSKNPLHREYACRLRSQAQIPLRSASGSRHKSQNVRYSTAGITSALPRPIEGARARKDK